MKLPPSKFFLHSKDYEIISDFAAPFVMPGAKKSSSSTFTPNEEALMMIMSMGFTRDQGIKALKATVSTC